LGYLQRARAEGWGLVASIATCPLDVVKTKLQAQRAVVGQQGYLGVLDALFSALGPSFLDRVDVHSPISFLFCLFRTPPSLMTFDL
jgi:hypothetical protein